MDFIFKKKKISMKSLMFSLTFVAFFVFDLAAAEVVLERGETTGEVRWTAGYEIELILTPGIVTSDGRGAPKYRINVRSGDRRRLDGVGGIPQ